MFFFTLTFVSFPKFFLPVKHFFNSQLNLFLSKLTGTQIGFTTSGLLTITKEFILTVSGYNNTERQWSFAYDILYRISQV